VDFNEIVSFQPSATVEFLLAKLLLKIFKYVFVQMRSPVESLPLHKQYELGFRVDAVRDQVVKV
jgi:hypothetical protein